MSVGVNRAVFDAFWRFEGMMSLAEGSCSLSLLDIRVPGTDDRLGQPVHACSAEGAMPIKPE
jgi:hypothetical protein